ncbi:unnamed protein product, partial [Chrysoparadoxa australica]
MLIGGGYQGELYCWDMWGQIGLPLMRFIGHRAPIVRVSCAPRKGRCVSLDETGKLILWDTRRNVAVDSGQRLLYAAHAQGDKLQGC